MPGLQNKISLAKAKLLVEYPLFGAMASKLQLIENNDIQSFKSNGIKLEYNSDYLEKLDTEHMEFVFANGAMHASLFHERRKNGRSGWLWQLSSDYAINDMLVENDLKRPDGAHYSKRFSGLYVEEIYEMLKEDILRDELEYENDYIDDEQKDETKENQDGEDLNEELFSEFAKAALKNELKSNEAPIFIDRFFNIKSYGGKINWRDELKAALDMFHKDDYTLLPPSKKLLYTGIYLPSCIGQRFKFVVAIDSSGSIDDMLLSEFIGELNSLTNMLQNYSIDLLVCDDVIRSHKTFYGGDIIEADLRGGGATDFRAVFEFIESRLEDVKLLLYFTDLDGIFPQEQPSYAVKWISKKQKEIPFGDLIIIND